MPSASASLHEPAATIGLDVVERHRAIVSIGEELEAVDWYDQRAAATTDPDLRAVLEHNRDEEKEHAMMTLEWLRRHDPALDRHMRTYLFTDGGIIDIEKASEAEPAATDTGSAGAESSDDDLGLRNLSSESR